MDREKRTRGTWVGTLHAVGVREPGEDADGPLVEIHGEQGMVAFEVTDGELVDEFARIGVEVGAVLDDRDGDEKD